MPGILLICQQKATINAKDTLAYGTNIVGGVSTNKGGQEHLGLPVFNTVREVSTENLYILCIVHMLKVLLYVGRPWKS